MRSPLLALALAVACGVAASNVQAQVDSSIVLESEAFLSAHPDVNNRRRGMGAYEAGNHEEALVYFRRAARYADKPSQAMVAEMLWKGEGGPEDPALAYAWMDLAAERGYPGFTAIREHYWSLLDAAQREDAVARGAEVYAEYGDEVALRRMETVLRRERRRTTGSRTGFVGALEIQIPGPGGQLEQVSGHRFYDRKLWDPTLYQAWQDAVWMEPREAQVDVGEVEPLRSDPVPDDD